jgi:hypothetical protein
MQYCKSTKATARRIRPNTRANVMTCTFILNISETEITNMNLLCGTLVLETEVQTPKIQKLKLDSIMSRSMQFALLNTGLFNSDSNNSRLSLS